MKPAVQIKAKLQIALSNEKKDASLSAGYAPQQK
jgi:hypothetical protein